MRDMLCTCKRMGTCRACKEFAALPSSSPSPRQMTPMPNEPDYMQEAVTAAYTMGTIPRGLTREEAERIIEAAADPIRRDERAKVEAEVRERLEGEEFIRRLCERYFGKTGWVESRIPLIREALRESMHLIFEPSPESAFVALGDPTKPPPIKAALDNTPTPEEDR